MNILYLPIKRKWFYMIAEAIKTEEYREVKDYWVKRLMNRHKLKDGSEVMYSGDYKKFDVVRFKAGYGKNSPTMDLEFKGIKIDTGKEEWGAKPGKHYFVIKLGLRLDINLEPSQLRHCCPTKVLLKNL